MEYNDPIYVKLEKLDILYKLTDEKNFEFIITELKSYAITEFDQEIITKAFKYMGAITFKFPKACDLGVKCLYDIFNHGENYSLNQAIIIMRDFLRKYKNSKSLELLKIINLDFSKRINLPNSKCALLFILGEFADRINSSVEIVNWFSINFQNENEKVKSQILNASIKNFVIKPNASEDLTKYILEKAGEECENPDLRDRAYIYWRLLENDPDAAKEMLLREKPSFVYKDEEFFEKSLLDDLVENLTNISCLYQKKSSEMICTEDIIIENLTNFEKEEENYEGKNQKDNELKDKEKNKNKKKNKIIESRINTNDFDLLGLGDSSNNTITVSSNSNIYNLDIMDIFGNGKIDTSQAINDNRSNNNDSFYKNNFIENNLLDIPINNAIQSNFIKNSTLNNDEFSDIQFLENDEENSEINIFSKSTGISQPKAYRAFNKENRGKNGVCGLYISGLFHREKQNIYLGLHLENYFHLGMTNFSVSIGKNKYGLYISEDNNKHLREFILNSENKRNLIINVNINQSDMIEDENELFDDLMINVLIKNNLDDFIFKIPLYINVLNLENGKMTNKIFMEFFKKNSQNKIILNYADQLNKDFVNEESSNKVLEKNNIYLIAKNSKLDPPVYFYSGLIYNNFQYILEISFVKGNFKD